MQKFLNCETAAKGDPACARYVGESLKIVYRVNDFYTQGRFMAAGEIVDFVQSSKQWKMLGHGYDQGALATAQEQANNRRAVVAVYRNASGVGHVVLITPGELEASGVWGLKVPSASSFFYREPDKSFVDKKLSYAFTKQHLKDIVLYARNY